MKEFYERHLRELDNKLGEIYTVAIEEEEEPFNVLKELLELVEMQNVYTPIETEGIPEGSVYDVYTAYLENVRKRIIVLNKKIDEIEIENKSEIHNIKVLQKAFKEKLSNS